MSGRLPAWLACALWAATATASTGPGAGLTLLVDFDARPTRILDASHEDEPPPEEVRPPAVDGSLLEALSASGWDEARFLSLHVAGGGASAVFLLPPGGVEFFDLNSGGRLDGGPRAAPDIRLVHLAVAPTDRHLAVGTLRAAGESERGRAPSLEAEVGGIFRIDGEDRGKEAVSIDLGAEASLRVVGPAAALATGTSPSYPVTCIAGCGRDPKRSFDLVVLGDGFLAEDLPALRDRVRELAGRLLGVPGDSGRPGIAPFSEVGIRELVSIYLIEAPSKERHVTFCPCCAEELDTAFGVYGNASGVGIPSDYSTDDPASIERAVRLVDRSSRIEARLVVANCEEYGGKAVPDRRLAFVSAVPDPEEGAFLSVHELSHSVAPLVDEYLSCSLERNVRRRYVNVATPAQVRAGRIPWQDLARADEYDAGSGWRVRHECGQAEPTGADADALGLFWGAQFVEMSQMPCECDRDETPDRRLCGYYRPMRTCKMKDLWDPGFCRACSHELRCAVQRAARVEPKECRR